VSLEHSGLIPATHLGAPAVVLQNAFLRVAVLPDLGAKIASLVYRPQGFETLAQPTTRAYRRPSYGAPFADYDTSGLDDMFPTIDACAYPLPPFAGAALPDHGEVWSQPWDMSVEGDLLVGTVRSQALPLTLTRRMGIERDRLLLSYRVRNEGDAPAAFLWACHGLLACDEDSRIELPGVTRVVVVHDSPRLGARGTEHPFPASQTVAGAPCRLDRIAPRRAGTTEKYSVKGPVPIGEASLTLNHHRLRVTVRFPRELVPYLGVWLNQGGYKGEYHAALEPTTGSNDDLATAERHGTAVTLAPGASMTFACSVTVTAVA
jgi:galactose mutarotase-like enzyme